LKNKVFLGAGLIVILALVGLAGCSAAGVTAADVQPVSVNVNSQQGIWVTGEGTQSVTPDIAILNVGVSARAAKVSDAQAQAADAMAKVMAALAAGGIDPRDIQTQYYSIYQVSTPVVYNKTPDAVRTVEPALPPTVSQDLPSTVSPGFPPDVTPTTTEVTQYEVSNQVTVKIRTVANTGAIIDAVATAGGDNIRINGVSFSVDKPEQYNAGLRDLAVKDALAKAQDLAKLAGVTLGPATYIIENGGSQPYYYPTAVYRDSLGAGTSISPGQTDLTLTVQVNYSIQ
jgi:uncharacterized protein